MGLFWWHFLLLGVAALLLGYCSENYGDIRPSGKSDPSSRRSCPSDKFKCNSGRCVVKEYVCDNFDDCGDMSDERHVNCTEHGNYWIRKDSTTCSSGEFRCDNGRCIPEKYVCDNVPDCKDGRDETYVNCTDQGIPHTLSYLRTVISEPSKELPRFTAVAYLDGVFFERYTSTINRVQFVPPSLNLEMKQFSSYLSYLAQLEELPFRISLLSLQVYHNQTEGFHTWQCLEVCEFSEDGGAKVYHRDAYDGREQDSPHHLTRRIHRKMYFLDLGCMAWLEAMMRLGKEPLNRTVSPQVKVVRKASSMFCRIYGFYPKEINATWLKDDEDWEEETLRGDVLPNSDGTHYTWISIKINPKFRGRYKCCVEHAGLKEPLVVEESGLATASTPIWRGVLGGILGTLAFVLLVAGIIVYVRKNRGSNVSRTRVSHEASDEGKSEEEFCLSVNLL
ncbi:major histocompatibility complex class I-related gene protein-like isoform X1 [Elgaria multicarinata webbii]|uniref:major histocompatibility complex class I-related gene protein-like isoform X1 n=1 Tax=Elgaria multicarinata webbii TaxID=159646 RepID=UPI002FCD35D0